MTERKTVRVTIFHQNYLLAATDQDGEVESLAEEVDELMVDIAKRAGNVDTNRVAVLACLELIDRLHLAQREHHDLKDRVEEKTREFVSVLNAALQT